MYWYSVAGLPVLWRNKCLASSMVDAFSKVKVTRLGIFVSKASMIYCWSFLSAAVCASGSASVSGCWSLWRARLSQTPTNVPEHG